MNPVSEEILSYYGLSSDESLKHYGTPRHSGRYPWGSGKDPYQRTGDLLGRIDILKKDGWTETPENIMKEFGLTTTQYRAQKALAKDERWLNESARAKSLKEDGLSNVEIGKILGKNESSVRLLLDPSAESRRMQAMATADFLREQVDTKGMIDIGVGVERELNVSREKLNQALSILEAEGYNTFGGGVPQVTNKGQQTNIKVLCPPDTPYKINDKGQKVSSAIYDFDNVHTINDYITRDGGDTYEKKYHYPESMNSSRLKIRYAEEGGIEKDGVIELRRGVQDLSLGESRYSQVRILVDGTHYLKGMAVYGDDKDFPDGVDVIFNTNKHVGTPALGGKDATVLKQIKSDPDNPFGSTIKDISKGGQYWYENSNGEKKLGLINKRADEGDWTEWQDKLPAQFLSKQSHALAKKQLELAAADKQAEFDDINVLTNPTVKKHLLYKFADECDSAAVHLQAAALPGQKYHVIVPVSSLKDTEVYAPGYEQGSKLALIRYPHGGTFEIPILTVNNKNKDAEKIIGKDSIDAICINHSVADRLSGADFDGDTVMCIPTHDKQGKVKISSTNPENSKGLKSIIGFDPKSEYGMDEPVKVDENGVSHYYRNGREYRIMKNTQTEMGKISNLITDMTLLGADDFEIARAVKHSMVVIDAEKHKLDYKQSEIDNDIPSLKNKYQGGGGASTLISRSKGQQTVPKRQGSPSVNMKGRANYDPSKPEGALIFKNADDLYYPARSYDKDKKEITIITDSGKKISYNVNDKEASDYYNPVKKTFENSVIGFTNKDGTIRYSTKMRTQRSTKMAETSDATTLISDADTAMERLYADYANRMKSLANQARKEAMTAGKIEYSPQAKETYAKEVSSLNAKLNTALLNAPRERQANLRAASEVNAKIAANPNMSNADIQKAGQQSLSKARDTYGSVSRRDRSINITNEEWAAIQAGAISESQLKKILNNTDIDVLREKATPRTTKTLSQAKINKIKAMNDSNYTIGEIAKSLGVSNATVSNYLKGE